MKNTIREYQETFIELIHAVECTGILEASLDSTDGLAAASEVIVRNAKRGGKVLAVGNGGSSVIASHIAIDCWNNAGIRAMAFNDAALLTCISNDFGYENVFEKPIAFFADENDTLIAISSSGQSENILRAAKAARHRGCTVITLSGFRPNNPLRRLGDYNLYVPASEYGFVEVIHQYLCHCLFDAVAKTTKGKHGMAQQEKGVHEIEALASSAKQTHSIEQMNRTAKAL